MVSFQRFRRSCANSCVFVYMCVESFDLWVAMMSSVTFGSRPSRLGKASGFLTPSLLVLPLLSLFVKPLALLSFSPRQHIQIFISNLKVYMHSLPQSVTALLIYLDL